MSFSRAKLIVSILLLPTLTSSLAGQIANDCPKRSIIVNVRDKQGRVVEGLPSTAFRPSIHGLPVNVLSSRIEKAPHRVVLMLDVSGSMLMPNVWPSAKGAAIGFVTSPYSTGGLALVLSKARIADFLDFTHTPNSGVLWYAPPFFTPLFSFRIPASHAPGRSIPRAAGSTATERHGLPHQWPRAAAAPACGRACPTVLPPAP
jgi:hypothetical protein